LRGDFRRKKDRLLHRIREIDDLESLGYSYQEHDLERNQLELELEELLQEEGLYWQQRGREKWILEWDNNTNFFHLSANGRRRRKIHFNS